MSQTASELRIFISSTFRDLREEREYLIKRIFPGIRQLCRERGVELTEIDLRWGLTEEEATQGKIIRTCLEEIDRCRPYFIGIIGDRYGWSPKFHEVQKDAELVRLYPWIEDMSADGASILEMEFEYAVLRDPSHAIGAYFYFRKHPEGYDYETDEHKRIEALKKRTRASKRPVKEFVTPAEFGEQVRADLTRLIELHWHKENSDNPLEIERASHEAFASTRRRAYILNPDYLKIFNAFVDAESQTAPLVITGISGIGKSSLMAYLAHSYARRNPNSFVVSHFIGASTSTSDHSGLLRHICLEIKERLDLPDEVPTTTEDLTREFPNWLAKVQDEKFIIFIDALNQLEGLSVNLNWLPGFLPPNIRIAVSTTEGESLEALDKLNAPKLILTPIDADQREAIIVRFLGEFHKSLNQPEVRRIAQDEKTSVPLFLRTLLEELRLVGSFSQIDSKIDHYLSCNDTADLFRRVLERMEKDYSATLVEEFMTLIWSARYGLSESELLALLEQPGIGPDNQPFTRLDLSLMLNALDFHLIRKDGLLNFFHNYLRDAVENRYLSTEEKKKALHIRLGKYFSAEPAAKRRLDEEPWQWQNAEQWETFGNCLADISMLEGLLEEDRLYQMIAYWQKVQPAFTPETDPLYSLERLEQECKNEDKLAELASKLGKAFVTTSHYKPAEVLLRKALEIKQAKHGEHDLEVAQAMNDLAELFYYTANFEEAEKLFTKAIDIRKEILGENHPMVAKSMNDLGAIYFKQRKLENAEKMFRDAIVSYENYFSKDHSELAETLNNIGLIFLEKRQFFDATQFLIRSLEMQGRLHGNSTYKRLLPLGNLAEASKELGEYKRAELLYKEALDLTMRIYGINNNQTSICLSNLGTFYSSIGKYDEAVKAQLQALEIKKKILGDSHYSTINSQIGLGIIYLKLKQYEKGKSLIDAYLPKLEEMLGPNHNWVKKNKEQVLKLSN